MDGSWIAAIGFGLAGLVMIGWWVRARLLGRRSGELVFGAVVACLASLTTYGLQQWWAPMGVFEPGFKSHLALAAPLLGFTVMALEHRFVPRSKPPTERAERGVDYFILTMGVVVVVCAVMVRRLA